MPALEIDLFSDVVCPWCFVGTERLEQVLASKGVEAEVRHHPFLLSPDTPAEGRNVHQHLRKLYGRDPGPIFARVEAAARETGIELDLSRQPFNYPTLPAHVVIRKAAAHGTQRALARELFRTHFIEARNISDPEVLSEVAGRHGFTPDEVRTLLESQAEREHTLSEIQSAQAMGIRGVPFFVFNRRLAVSGAQPVAIFEKALSKAAELGPPPP
jgi:predicted DsbA family dithiol-disulfide isomerase